MKLLQRVKIAHSFYSLCQFCSTLSFYSAYVVLHIAVKEFSKPTFKYGEIGRFNRSSLTESFYLEISLIHSI